MSKSSNIVWHHGLLTQDQREEKLQQKGAVIWLTGLSGSGKSTVARALEKALIDRQVHCYVLDGDNIRHGLNKDLGFSEKERTENIRRIGEVSRLFFDANIIVISAFISPLQRDRDGVRALIDKDRFFEVYCDTALDICESRDPKGLYKKARAGEIPDFTGISAPYEAPQKPEIILQTGTDELKDSVDQLIHMLEDKKIIK